jgi:hypothetical protein
MLTSITTIFKRLSGIESAHRTSGTLLLGLATRLAFFDLRTEKLSDLCAVET